MCPSFPVDTFIILPQNSISVKQKGTFRAEDAFLFLW
jgi:hypothetical protein